MTSTIAITCPEGVVLGADKYITYPMSPDRTTLTHVSAEKIYLSEKTNVGISFWGLADYGNKKGIEFLKEFDEKELKSTDRVDEIASKLKIKLEAITPKIEKRCGFHIGGYSKSTKKPKLRHIFHENWHDDGQFTNEDCHKEYHDIMGNRVVYRCEKDYPILFNGDNFIANSLFNVARLKIPYIRIIPETLSIRECKELVALVITTSINRLDYYFDTRKYKKIDPDVGGGVSILVIKDDSATLIPFEYKPIHEVLQDCE